MIFINQPGVRSALNFTIMNRLKFSEGGQPVYLDDFKLLQDNSKDVTEKILAAICQGSRTMLLQKLTYRNVTAGGKQAIDVAGGCVFLEDDDFVEWPETVLAGAQSIDDVWLCVRDVENCMRLFDDGQPRACYMRREGYLTTEPDGAATAVKLVQLRCINDLVRGLIGYEEPQWQDIDVNFNNGYAGKVQYKELDDCYRVRIDLKSDDYTPIESDPVLFYTEKDFMQFFETADVVNVVSENAVNASRINFFEGQARLSLTIPFDDIYNAASLPLKAVFEIPK